MKNIYNKLNKFRVIVGSIKKECSKHDQDFKKFLDYLKEK